MQATPRKTTAAIGDATRRTTDAASQHASPRPFSSSTNGRARISHLRRKRSVQTQAARSGSPTNYQPPPQRLSIFVQNYAPWFLPQFEALFALPQLSEAEDQHASPPSSRPPTMPPDLDARIAAALPSLPPDSPLAASAASLRSLLPMPHSASTQLKTDIATIASEARAPRRRHALRLPLRRIASASLHRLRRQSTQELHSACYDLLASEARIASFIAVAKGDIPQQSWFRLDRSHVLVDGHPALLSWTGTMFEYMMPSLWMRTFPNTLIVPLARVRRSHPARPRPQHPLGHLRIRLRQRWILKAGTAIRLGEFRRWP